MEKDLIYIMHRISIGQNRHLLQLFDEKFGLGYKNSKLNLQIFPFNITKCKWSTIILVCKAVATNFYRQTYNDIMQT